jgi:hypothetical protein
VMPNARLQPRRPTISPAAVGCKPLLGGPYHSTRRTPPPAHSFLDFSNQGLSDPDKPIVSGSTDGARSGDRRDGNTTEGTPSVAQCFIDFGLELFEGRIPG